MQFLIPILADLIGLALAFFLLPALGERFQDLDFINSVILGLFFLLFCLSVFGIKKLRPALLYDDKGIFSYLLRKRTLSALGVFFSLVLTVALGYVVGFLDSVVAINRGLLDEPSVTMYLLLTPASWFGLALIYMLLLASETEATVARGTSRYWLISLLGLSGVNLMAVSLAASGQAVVARLSPSAPLPLAALFFIFLLLLFGPPRLLYQARQNAAGGWLTFLPLLAFLAYRMVR